MVRRISVRAVSGLRTKSPYRRIAYVMSREKMTMPIKTRFGRCMPQNGNTTPEREPQKMIVATPMQTKRFWRRTLPGGARCHERNIA